jgi:hypothetical protein
LQPLRVEVYIPISDYPVKKEQQSRKEPLKPVNAGTLSASSLPRLLDYKSFPPAPTGATLPQLVDVRRDMPPPPVTLAARFGFADIAPPPNIARASMAPRLLPMSFTRAPPLPPTSSGVGLIGHTCV